jgi:hypothetical protein
MAKVIHVAEAIREQLRMALVAEPDLVDAVRRGTLEPIANPPGCFRALPTLAVPRPLDPETAELRRLEVFLRPVADGYELYAIRGLDLAALEE